MFLLVANLGSTSFKYRLFDMRSEEQLARGGIERIGQAAEGTCFVEISGRRHETQQRIADHAAAVQICLAQLTNAERGCLKSVDDVGAIGFKAVFAGELGIQCEPGSNQPGVRLVTDEILSAMEDLADIAPAHNPPYARAMRQLQSAFPKMPLVAAFETGFHVTIPPENDTYACPWEWKEQHAVQKWGYHGASHRYIGERIAALTGRSDLRVISCHLGGSNSLCAMRGGVSLANTLGLTPQTGLPHNNRVGDFDPFALPLLMRRTGKSLTELLDDLSARGGLLGISGLSGDVRDLEEAAAKGNERADVALRVFIAEIRRYIGGYLTILNGVDAIVFTGGIGENSRRVRAGVCENMDFAGIRLDNSRNESAHGESRISSDAGAVELWVMPTNEELIVARQTAALLRPLTSDL